MRTVDIKFTYLETGCNGCGKKLMVHGSWGWGEATFNTEAQPGTKLLHWDRKFSH